MKNEESSKYAQLLISISTNLSQINLLKIAVFKSKYYFVILHIC